MPAWARLVYAFGAIGGNAIGRSRDLWRLFFYLGDTDDGDPMRRGAVLAIGAALVLVRIIEAFDDPIIGYWSDRTRTPLGRRIPYVLTATPFMAIFFVLLWVPPDPGESLANVFYLFFILWSFHLFSTLSGGPFESLLPEVATRYDDRMGIVSWQVLFGMVGAALALVASGPLIDVAGFTGMALLMAAVAFVSRFVALSGAWQRSIAASRAAADEPQMLSLREAVVTCLRNHQFLVFLPSFILYSVGVQMMLGVLPFFVEAVLERDNTGTWVGILTGTSIVFVILALPTIVVLARRRSKRAVYGWGMLFAGVYFPLMFFVGLIPAVPIEVQAIVFAALVGLPLAPVQTFPNALIADICDYDTLRTGMRREATYYATQATLEKTAGALAPGILTVLLLLGSTADNPIGIRLVGPVAGAATLIGYFVFRGYWLPDSVNEESVRGHAAAQGPRHRRS